MKKIIIFSGIIILITALLAESGTFSALIMFLLMGQVPGTSYSVPPSVMLLLLGATATLVVLRFTAINALRSIAIYRLAKKHLAHKARMPRRRFSQI